MKKHLRKLAILAASIGLLVVVPSASAAPVGSTYVALGDSFASGPGSGPTAESQSVYEPGTGLAANGGNECFRSSWAYPRLVANNKSYNLINASCAGATTDNILTTGYKGEVPQIDRVPANAAVVTVTIGGNDLGFSDIVGCVVTTDCTASSPAIVNGYAGATTIRGKIANVVNAVKAKAPSAKVVVTDYPKVIRATMPSSIDGCSPWATASERVIANDLQKTVNQQIHLGATDSGATFVETYDVSPFILPFGISRDACSLLPTRAMNGIIAPFQAASFHPNNQGQQALKQLVTPAV